MSGVQTLLPDSTEFPVSKLIDSFLSPKIASPEILKYDPKSIKTNKQPSWVDGEFDDIVVFMVGGGTYNEYDNLSKYFRSRHPNLRLTFGATEVLNASEFISQLSKLQ